MGQMNRQKPKFSIIAPVFNEVDGLKEFYKVLKSVMDAIGEEWEVLLVDDGATDGSREIILTLAG
jgi:dolichol-phosphate mannosyltransferase